MKCRLLHIFSAAALVSLAPFAMAGAPAGLTLTNESGAPGGSAAVTLSYGQANGITDFRVEIEYDETLLTPQVTGTDIDGCIANLAPPHSTSGFSACSDVSPGGNRLIRLSVVDQLGGSNVIPTYNPLGTITFDIDASAPIGVAIPLTFNILEVQDASGGIAASNLSTTDGSVTPAITGAAGFASNPSPASSIDLGSGVANAGASSNSPFNITVSEIGDQQLDVTAFPITGPDAGIFSTTAMPFSIVDGGAPVDVPVSCNPVDVGVFTATLEITNNSSNQPNAQYTLNCVGQAPNVQVAPTSLLLSGSIGAPTLTEVFAVSNPQTVDDTASNAQNATLTDQGNSGEISISDGLTNNVIAVDETDNVTVSCSTAAFGTFTETITVAWDDPVTGGQLMQDVDITCEIANVAPGYTSVPASPGPLAFGSVQNGDSSTLTIDIGNVDSVGTGTGAELEITGATLSDPTNYSFAPDPFTATLPAGAPNGTESLDVTCNPQSIGNFGGATVTVNTNDGDQVYNLTCEGTSNAGFAVSPAGALDGTLNLGSVPPSTLANGSMTISNTGTDPLEIDCTLTDNNMGVIAFNPVPAFPVTIPPDLTLTFEGTPPDIGTFSETLDCTVTDPSVTTAPDTFSTSIVVIGRPLVIPTMSRWGLAVMSLMMLLVAGFAGRRMLA